MTDQRGRGRPSHVKRLWYKEGNLVGAQLANSKWLPTSALTPTQVDQLDRLTAKASPVDSALPIIKTEEKEKGGLVLSKSDDALALAALVAKLAENGVDKDEVRVIAQTVADEKIAGLTFGPVYKQVQVNDRPVVTLEETTHEVFEDLVSCLVRGLHVYLVGPPGTGKTFLAKQAAKALGLNFGAIAMGPATMGSKLFGYCSADGSYIGTVFRDIYQNGGVFLYDEIDNGHPGTLAEINQALANGEAAFPDGMVERHKDARFIAAANTHGTGPTKQFVGRNQLDGATLDRFVEIEVGIDEELEKALTFANLPIDQKLAQTWLDRVRGFRANAQKHSLQVIISPRASIEGAIMLQGGFSIEKAEQMRVFKGLSPDIISKLRGN